MTDWGDVATWVGAAGTWVVGVAAAILAWQQRPRFRPHFACFVSTQQPGLMVITIANRGSGVRPDRPHRGDRGTPWSAETELARMG